MADSALVLIDYQTEWRDPESEFYVGDLVDIVARVNFLIDFCKARGYKIIFTKHLEPESPDHFGHNTQIIPELKLSEADVIIVKNKISPFYKTELDQELEGIHKVVVCGILTNLCVRSFIQEAYDRDMKVTVIKDCCAANTPEKQEYTFADLKDTREELEFINFEEFVE
ncbi:MAG: cysteine hydrolase [candidate division SR1 bacterium]|nr:cysteine hydrolase [candidate division SR1 bacterium]